MNRKPVKFNIFQIETTSRCNLGRCLVCPRTSINREFGDMDWEVYKKISKYFTNVKSVYLSGWGEPLMNEKLIEMVELAKSKDCFVGFTTNATLLDEEISESLIASGLDLIEISIDGATSNVYEGIRRGAVFEDVVENISKFIQVKDKLSSKKPKVMFSFVMMSKNIDELPQVVDLGHKMGIDHLIAKNVGLVLKELDEEQRIFSCNHGNIPKKVIKSIDKAKNKAKRYNLKLTISPLSLRTRPVCIALPVNSVYFTWKGKVSACDSLAHLDVPRIFCGKKEDSKPLRFFGDIIKEDLIDIWEKEQYRNFRDIFNRRLEIYNSFSYKFIKTFMSLTSGNEEDYAHVLPQAPKECQRCHYLYGIF